MTEKKLFGAEIPTPWASRATTQAATDRAGLFFEPGMMKSTYGTGCFAVLNTWRQAGAVEKNRLLSTIAYRWNGKTTYALGRARSSWRAPPSSGCATASR